MKKWMCMGLVAAMLLQMPAVAYARAPEDWIVEGATKIVKADETVNINPYNRATITGVGEGNAFRVVGVYETFDIPLKGPLYRLSENYRDQIVFQKGQWGVKRMIAVKVFDGSEDWSLLDSPGYQNNNTTIFKCSNGTPAILWDGISTHFDVFSKDDQKNNRYDGLSFGRDTSEFYMRIMNVRKVTTVEGLKAYLKAQYDANTPVKFLFVLEEPAFEPFNDEIQQKLNQADLSQLGFVDKNLQKVSKQPVITINQDIFPNGKTEQETMNQFLASVVDLKVLGGKPEISYYIEGIYKTDEQWVRDHQVGEGIGIVMKDSEGTSFQGVLETAKASFTKDKPAEVILTSPESENISIRILLNLAKADYPSDSIKGFTADDIPVSSNCVVKQEVVLPRYVAEVAGIENVFYLNNALLYGNTISYEEGVDAFVQNSGIRSVQKEVGAGKTRTALFFGDSLINQDLYTAKLLEIFEKDDMKLELIGTRGTENNRHEGRGGWSAYDYCNVESKYGYTNPFLNNGKFDFGYYMTQNNFEHLDTIVINLGVNDLNLVGHNAHQEILGYFDQIIASIKNYDPNVKILLNTPTMLYDSESTKTAKNQRLELIKSLKVAYEGREDENIWIVPTYLSLHPYMDFKQVEPVVDEFNQDHSLTVTDTTHPNVLGYQALAEMTFSYLKFLETAY